VNAALAEQVLAVAAQHLGDFTAENTAEFSAAITSELSDPGAAPLSLTAGQRP
jgi:hypothetical protein